MSNQKSEWPLPFAEPEEVGISSEGLSHISSITGEILCLILASYKNLFHTDQLATPDYKFDYQNNEGIVQSTQLRFAMYCVSGLNKWQWCLLPLHPLKFTTSSATLVSSIIIIFFEKSHSPLKTCCAEPSDHPAADECISKLSVQWNALLSL